jgi:hypothetical protein
VDRSGAFASTGSLERLTLASPETWGGPCCRSMASATVRASSSSPRAESRTSRPATCGGVVTGAPRSVQSSGSTIISRSGPSTWTYRRPSFVTAVQMRTSRRPWKGWTGSVTVTYSADLVALGAVWDRCLQVRRAPACLEARGLLRKQPPRAELLALAARASEAVGGLEEVPCCGRVLLHQLALEPARLPGGEDAEAERRGDSGDVSAGAGPVHEARSLPAIDRVMPEFDAVAGNTQLKQEQDQRQGILAPREGHDQKVVGEGIDRDRARARGELQAPGATRGGGWLADARRRQRWRSVAR